MPSQFVAAYDPSHILLHTMHRKIPSQVLRWIHNGEIDVEDPGLMTYAVALTVCYLLSAATEAPRSLLLDHGRTIIAVVPTKGKNMRFVARAYGANSTGCAYHPLSSCVGLPPVQGHALAWATTGNFPNVSPFPAWATRMECDARTYLGVLLDVQAGCDGVRFK